MPKNQSRDKQLLHKFTIDAVDKCTAEINQAHALYAGDADNIKQQVLLHLTSND